MPTIRLVPSTYSLSNSTYLSVSNASNMYNNTDNTSNYATVTNSQTGTTSYYIYIKGFNFDSIPSNATVTSFTVKFRAMESGVSTSTSYRPYMCNNTTTITGNCSVVTTTSQVLTFTGVTASWDTIKGYGSNFGIRLNCRRNARNTTGYMYIYGAEILVEYTVPTPATVTSTLSGDGTINPSGAYSTYNDEEYTLTITPTNKSNTVSATKNNVDITNSLVPHYNINTITGLAQSFTTQLSATGANFYTGSNTTGNYFNYAVNHSAESPGSTSTSYNTYVKDSGSNTATGTAIYSFNFSSIPSDAIIDSVSVKCYGACENTTHDATHRADITLYSGSTAKSTTQNFTSTSNSTITISNPGTWTREELQSATLHFTVAYYGGRLFGITWTVTYRVGNSPEYYTYTYTVSGDATIAVVISGENDALYLKVNGSWVEVSEVYVKTNGSWVKQTDISNIFNTNVNYVQR